MSLIAKQTDSLEVAGQQIFYWHLELSSKCALKCPRCPRTERPGQYKVTEMNLKFIKKLFPPERLFYVEKILLSGGQGDPIYCDDFIKIIRYFKETKEDLQLCITTNGSYKKRAWWQEVAQILNENDIVIFSVDGWDQKSNTRYRVNSDFESIVKGLKILRQYNPKVIITWSTIIFKFNQHKMDDIKNLAESLGVDAFNVVRSGLFGSSRSNYIDPKLGYDPLEPDKEFTENLTNRGFYVHFTKRQALKTIRPLIFKLMAKYQDTYKSSFVIPLCRIGERGLYIDAEGILYPCSWISHPFDLKSSKRRNKSIAWEKSLWVEHKDHFNLNKHSLEEILSSPFWKKLQCSWLDSKKAFVECENYCHFSESKMKIAKLRSKIFYDRKESKQVLKTVGICGKAVKKEADRIEWGK